jgi:hypothetical protein
MTSQPRVEAVAVVARGCVATGVEAEVVLVVAEGLVVGDSSRSGVSGAVAD